MDRYEEALERAKKGLPIDEVFPELKESEDERIRKFLVELVSNDKANNYNGLYKVRGVRFDDVLAYLEKQKDASYAIEAVDRIDKYIDEHLANAHDMKDSNPDKKYYRGWDDALGKMAGILQDVYSDEKQKEQKPAEWSEEDKGILLSIKCVIDEVWHSKDTSFGYSKEELEEMWNWLDIAWQRLEYPKENKEWSEEDERKRQACISTINEVIDYERERWEDYNPGKPYRPIMKYDEQIDWLKSLRPQPKQEWSEEDDNALVLFHELISFGYTERFCDAQTAEDMRRWLNERLKSPRPQPHWKPSKEQIEALENSTALNEEQGAHLYSLLCDLKKLL